jgi:GT2 family glycosyltransferase
MKLSIIIVSWNVRDYVLDCLHSIAENPPAGQFEVIVVDNASSDGTIEAVKNDWPQVITIANSENRGFAAANNQGIKRSKGRYVFFLNPDTLVHPHALDILTDFMDKNPDVGACGPKLLNKDGSTQRSVRRFPTFRAALHQHTIFRRIGLFRRQYHKWLMKDFTCDTQADVDQLMGAAMMVRRAVIDQIGPMDECFFMYFEEVDLCYRMKHAGWRIMFIPQAVCTHLGGQSARQVPVGSRITALTSLLHYFRKHRGRLATAVFNCFFKPAVILRDLCNLLTGITTYILATMCANNTKREKSLAKVKNSATMLTKYSWRLLSRM